MVKFVYQQDYSSTDAAVAIANLEQVRKKLMGQIKKYSNTKIEQLQTMLNNIFTNAKATEMTKALFDNMSVAADNALADMTPDTKTMSVKYSPGTESAQKIQHLRQQYYGSKNQSEMLLDDGLQTLSSTDDFKTLWGKIMKLQTPLNKATGQMFENALQMTVPVIQQTAAQKSGNIVDKQVQAIIDSIDISTKAKKPIRTAGSEKISLTFSVDDQVVKWAGTGKVDVRVPSPFHKKENELMNISAKSYSTLTNIGLLKGQVLPLIADWPVSQKSKTQNYFYNALHFYDTNKYLQYTRLIFAIQSLAGIAGNGERAGVFISYIRNRKEPIVVHSVYNLLTEILNERNVSEAEQSILVSFSSTLPLPDNQDTFGSQAQSLIINTHLNKKYLAMEYLRKRKASG